jgi:microcystin-dependent protein
MALPVLSANSPSAGLISWTGFSIAYGGINVAIAAGNTSHVYAYWLWNGGAPLSALTFADVAPTLTDDDLMLFVNRNGIPVSVQGANVVDGSLITTGSIIGTSVAAGTIQGANIAAGTLTAGNIQAGAITANELSTSSIGAAVVVNGDMNDPDPVTYVPSGWTPHYVNSGTAATFGQDTVTPLSGSTSLTVTEAANSLEGLAARATPVKGGDSIMFGVAFRTSVTGVPITLRAYFGTTDGFLANNLVADIPALATNIYIYDVSPTGMTLRNDIPTPLVGPGISAVLDGFLSPVTTTLYVTGQITAPPAAKFVRFMLASGLPASPANTTTWDALTYAPVVTGVTIANGAIKAQHLAAGSIDAMTITGAFYRTAVAGQRTEIDVNGLRSYDATGAQKVSIPNNGNPITVEGTIIANAFTSTGNAQIQGAGNNFAVNSVTSLATGIGAPTTPPVAGVSYPWIQSAARTSGVGSGCMSNVTTGGAITIGTGGVLTTASAHGIVVGQVVQLATVVTSTGIAALTPYYVIAVGSTTTLTLSATINGAALTTTAGTGTGLLANNFMVPMALTGPNNFVKTINPVTGATMSSITLPDALNNKYIMSMVLLGSYFWCATYDYTTGPQVFWLERYNSTTGAFVDRVAPWAGVQPYLDPTLATDGTYIYVGWCYDATHIHIEQRTANAAWTLVATNTATDATGSDPMDSNLAGLLVGNLDYGAQRFVVTAIQTSSSACSVHTYTLAGTTLTEQTNEQVPRPAAAGQLSGMFWDGMYLWLYDAVPDKIWQLGGTKWTTASSNWWISYAWYTTPGGGGPFQSVQSPRANLTMLKRGRLSITVPPIPTGADSVMVYVGLGAADPGIALMYHSLPPPTAAQRVFLCDLLTMTGNQPLAATTFIASGTPAVVESQALRLDGTPIWTLLGSGVLTGMNPVGTVLLYGGSVAPVGYLLCTGQSVLRATYPDLFAVIGTSFGSVDGSHFTLPAPALKFPYGATPGTTGGEGTHLLTTAEMPSHQHTQLLGGSVSTVANVSGGYVISNANNSLVSATGGGGAHNNIPPWLGFNFIIAY